MTVTTEDIVRIALPVNEISTAISFAYHVLAHKPSRPEFSDFDPLLLFIHTLLEETAERMVLYWLRENGKYAEPVADKGATTPDISHDIWVEDIRNRKVHSRVKTILDLNSCDLDTVLISNSLEIPPDEARGINLVVCYWFNPLLTTPRQAPGLQRSAIMAWMSDKNLRETRKVSRSTAISLQGMRPVSELLEYLLP